MQAWKQRAFWIWIIIVFGIFLRIVYASLSVDIADHYANLITAKSMRECRCIPTLDLYGTAYLYRPPASHFWLALFMPYPKIAPVLFGLALIGLTYLVARRLGMNMDDALFSTAVFSVIPIAVEFSSINSLDIFTGVYIFLGIYMLFSERIFWVGIFAGLGFLSKYDAFAFAPIPAVYLFWKKQWKHLILYCAVFIIFVLPWFARMMHIFGNPFYPYFESLFGHYATPAQGHAVPLFHYLLGFPLTLFGVPEGDHRTALLIAAGWGIPSPVVWFFYLATILVAGVVMFGTLKFFKGLSPQHKLIIGLSFLGYALFFAIRIFVPIGSEVFDLRYALGLIPFLAMGVSTLEVRWRWILLGIFVVGSIALTARFALSREAFSPYQEALDFVDEELPPTAVVLFDNDASIFSYGIEYHTGRLSFPFLEHPINKHLYHIPYLQDKYDFFRHHAGPPFLWTTNTTFECGSNQLFKNRAISICRLDP